LDAGFGPDSFLSAQDPESEDPMDVSIVIPSWRGRHLLEAYLPSILAASDHYQAISGARSEILVVEDAGGDDTAAWLRARYGTRVQCLEHDRNQGFCAACQTGFEHARYPVVLLLNNDVRLESDCIAPLLDHFRDSSVFAVTGKMFNQKGDTFCNGGKIGHFRRGMWTSYRNYDIASNTPPQVPCLSFAAIAAFAAYDREKYLQIGGLDPLTAMYEDIEISYRAWKRGWSIRYEPRSVAYHDASQTIKRFYRGQSREKLSRRSRILMHWILLHDRKMFLQHVALMIGRALTGWIILDWAFYWAIATALQNLATIRRKRVENRLKAVRSDREVQQLLEDYYRSAPIKVY
jgi:GT2 family glycosyltransferase